MSTVTLDAPIFVDPKSGEPDWLISLREEAASHYSCLPFPSRASEEWKYTQFNEYLDNVFEFDDKEIQAKLPEQVVQSEGYLLVFVNGLYRQDLSKLDLNGITVQPLSQAINEHSELVSKHLRVRTPEDQTKFTALNLATMQDGLFIYTPKGVKVDKPIQIVYLDECCKKDKEERDCAGDNEKSGGIVSQYRNIIIMDNSSSANIMEYHVGADCDTHFCNHVTDIILHDNSQLDYCTLQNQSQKALHISNTQAVLSRDAVLNQQLITLGGAKSRYDINIKLSEPGAHCDINGFYLSDAKQHVDIHTHIDHLSAHTSSQELVKGIAGGNSRAVFNGMVFVNEQAQKVDSSLANKNILLSKTAEVDTKPELEIYADDVKCAHGATVGELDEQSLFYLRSRGIPEIEARSLLLKSFATDILDAIKSEHMHNHCQTMIANKLSGKP